MPYLITICSLARRIATKFETFYSAVVPNPIHFLAFFFKKKKKKKKKK